MKDELQFVFFHLFQVCGYGIQHSFGVGGFACIELCHVFCFDLLTDSKQFMFDLLVCQNHDLPRSFEISVVISVGFDIALFGKPCIIIL